MNEKDKSFIKMLMKSQNAGLKAAGKAEWDPENPEHFQQFYDMMENADKTGEMPSMDQIGPTSGITDTMKGIADDVMGYGADLMGAAKDQGQQFMKNMQTAPQDIKEHVLGQPAYGQDYMQAMEAGPQQPGFMEEAMGSAMDSIQGFGQNLMQGQPNYSDQGPQVPTQGVQGFMSDVMTKADKKKQELLDKVKKNRYYKEMMQ